MGITPASNQKTHHHQPITHRYHRPQIINHHSTLSSHRRPDINHLRQPRKHILTQPADYPHHQKVRPATQSTIVNHPTAHRTIQQPCLQRAGRHDLAIRGACLCENKRAGRHSKLEVAIYSRTFVVPDVAV